VGWGSEARGGTWGDRPVLRGEVHTLAELPVCPASLGAHRFRDQGWLTTLRVTHLVVLAR